MNNVKNIKLLYLITILSISIPLFSVNLNQGMNNQPQEAHEIQNEPKIRSELKRRYKPKTEEEIVNQEKVVDIAKLKIPLRALCLNRIIDRYIFLDKDKPDDNLTNEQNGKLIIDKKEFHDFIESHNLLTLLETIQRIKNKGYRNNQLVERLINLTANPEKKDSNPNDSNEEVRKNGPIIQDFYNLKEAIYLEEEELALYLIKKGALKVVLDEFDLKSDESRNKRSKNVSHDSDNEHNTDDEDNSNNDFINGFKAYEKLKNLVLMSTRKNLIKVVEQLLEISKSYEYDEANIIYAAYPCVKTKEMLSFLTCGMIINLDSSSDRKHRNCLQNATVAGDIEFIDFLLGYKASPFATNQSGLLTTAISFALAKMEKKDPLEYEKGKDILLKFAAYANTYRDEHILISIALEVNISDETKAEAISYILEKYNIDIDEEDNKGMTVLMYAAKNILYNVVKVLLKQNPNVFLTNYDGYTALELAEKELIRESQTFWSNSVDENRAKVGAIMLDLLKQAHFEQMEYIANDLMSKYFDDI